MEEDALLVLVDPSPPHILSGNLVRIPFTGVRDSRFEHAGGFRRNFFRYLIAFGEEHMEPYRASGELLAEDAEARSHLRLLSRYPQGVSEEMLARPEEAYGEIETLDPGGQ